MIGGQRSPDAPVRKASPWARRVTAVTRSPLHHPIFTILLSRRVVMGGSSDVLLQGPGQTGSPGDSGLGARRYMRWELHFTGSGGLLCGLTVNFKNTMLSHFSQVGCFCGV
jgi:hypothetical protein